MATGLFNLKQVNQAISQGAWSGYIAPKWVEYLVVAGGGSGGGNGGGGGAGGLLTGIVTVAAGTSYTVTVGAGGTGGVYPTQANGNNSVFGSISATAGGKGGGDSSSYPAGSGGSGGGSGYYASIGQGTSGQGNAGGAQNGLNSGGGGGGAGTVGLNGASTTIGGNGGAGIASAITGTVVTYAGGGGGWANTPGTGGTGGVGGGGSAGAYQGVAGSGSSNTGGGGAGSAGGSGTSGSGGSGVVVVRYPGNVQFYTGGTVNYNNGYIIHIFTSSGTLAPTTPTVYNTSYQISRSLRFNSADSAYLSRTYSNSATDLKKQTFSFWYKRTEFATTGFMFGGYDGSSASSFAIGFFTTNGIGNLTIQIDGTSNPNLLTTQVFRDPSAWYHIVIAIDTTQATSSNRLLLYVNGSQVTSFSTATYPALNSSSQFALTNSRNAVGSGYSGNSPMNGYMTEVNFIDGQALTPSSFGATSTTNGVWAPIQYTGTYGTNGFYLNFSDNSNTTAATLGKDYSGNGNNWTPNNFSVTAGAGNDSLIDSPTAYGFDTGVGGTVRGNYATLNPLVVNKPNLTNGNLDADGSDLKTAISTMGVSSGKWYWEVLIGSGTNTPNMGVTSYANDNADPGVYLGVGRSYVSSGGGGGIYKAYTATSTTANSAFSNANTAGATIGFALDCDAGTLAYYVNNVLGYTDSTIATGTLLYPMTCNFNSTLNNYRNTSFNFGQRPFAYTAPSGYKALCTQNLPTPTIGATSTTLANLYFNPVLYTGDRTDRTITVGFQPDWVWVKSRSAADDHYLMNAVVGTGKYLSSNSTAAETTNANTLTAYTSTGFSVGNTGTTNETGRTYVAWNWKANGSGSANNAGTLASIVSANPTSGFSIVTYTGTSATASVGHGLGAVPSMVIAKGRSGGSASYFWAVWHRSVYATNQDGYLNLSGIGGIGTASGVWSTYFPTSSVFYVGGDTSTSASAATYVAYCFAEVAGYSKFGSYTGNGSADGVFVFTGFRPAYVMVKLTSASGEGWWVFDNKRNAYNVTNSILSPNSSGAEITGDYGIDFTANGFKIRNAQGFDNSSGATYIYAAFAEAPLKYSLAR